MSPFTSAARWGSVAIALHWIVFALVVAQMVLAGMAAELTPGPSKDLLMQRHMTTGVIIFCVTALRAAWRLAGTAPPESAALTPFLRFCARAAHISLYALLLALPITGWLMSSAAGTGVSILGWFDLPPLIEANKGVFELLQFTHRALSWLLGIVVLMHVSAALVHHFMLRDDILMRMLPHVCRR